MVSSNMYTTPKQSIVLPPLEAPEQRHALGIIRHALFGPETVEVQEVRPIRVSPRKIEELYILANGQSVIITERRNIPRPAGVDGVLRTQDGRLQWVSHRLQEDFRSRLESLGWDGLRDQICSSWENAFQFKAERVSHDGVVTQSGLRPPQVGALHAVGSHWSLQHQPATVIMPTGTGKTETMMGVLAAFIRGTMLVVVPTGPLRDQTAIKFLTFGLLRALGTLGPQALNPIVGVIRHRPRTADHLDIFSRCHIVVATMSALGQGDAAAFAPAIAERIEALVVDEAHHIAANTWTGFRDHFRDRKVLQFTATPFRRDAELVDGKIVYSYPLHRAQQDGYFKPIGSNGFYRRHGLRAAFDQQLANLFGCGRSTGLARRAHLKPGRAQGLGQARDLRRLARPFPAFQCDETAALSRQRGRACRLRSRAPLRTQFLPLPHSR